MRRLLLLGLMLSAAACGGKDQENAADRPDAAAGAAQAATPAARPAPPAPAALQEQVEALAKGFDGEVGVAVKDLGSGWTAAWSPERAFPQQSVMKVWLAVAVLDRVDRGELSLDDTLLLGPEDLSVHHQPIKGAVLDDGRHVATIGELLRLAIARSDNAATDALMRHMGGTERVEAVLARKGFPNLRVGPEERILHTQLAGLTWRPELAFPQVFDQARQAVPVKHRQGLIEAYLRDPSDGASPTVTVQALEALKHGRLLSRGSTDWLLAVMSDTRTGRSRLKAGLEEGWLIAHKTGTGPDVDTLTVGYNDVGLLTAPDGRVYAVAAYIARTETGIRARQQFLSGVSRAVVDHWKGAHAPKPADQGPPVGPAAPAREDNRG
jgi:beta-lactamase class A